VTAFAVHLGGQHSSAHLCPWYPFRLLSCTFLGEGTGIAGDLLAIGAAAWGYAPNSTGDQLTEAGLRAVIRHGESQHGYDDGASPRLSPSADR